MSSTMLERNIHPYWKDSSLSCRCSNTLTWNFSYSGLISLNSIASHIPTSDIHIEYNVRVLQGVFLNLKIIVSVECSYSLINVCFPGAQDGSAVKPLCDANYSGLSRLGTLHHTVWGLFFDFILQGMSSIHLSVCIFAGNLGCTNRGNWQYIVDSTWYFV